MLWSPGFDHKTFVLSVTLPVLSPIDASAATRLSSAGMIAVLTMIA